VTRGAVARYPGVIKRCRHKTCRVVADAAILISRQMTIAFAGSKPGIMAGGAVVDDTDMIEGCGRKARSYMAAAAIVVGRYVEAGLSGCRRPVMA
jgi:hypothetical protein